MRSTRLRPAVAALALLAAAAFAPTPAAAQPTELLLSEYVEGSSLNKAVEIFNGTGAAVDLGLAGYQLQVYFNGNPTAGATINLVGTIAPGDVFVVADDGADAAILAVTDQTTPLSLWNGNDALVLRKSGAAVDSLGQVGFDPGSQWGTGDVSTQDNTIRRKASVCAGDTIVDDVFDPAPEWDGFPNNTFDGLGAHAVSCAPPADPWVINEIHADPHPTEGDANGDGTVNTSEDEFVEIVNNTGATQDVSGWTLSDGVGVRHVFPPGSVVADGCAIVVFGGGTPTGSFGGVVVQTASSGLIGLNNGGDSVTLDDGVSAVATAAYGSEGGNDQSLTLDPDVTGTAYVLHTAATGAGGARFSPGTRIDGTAFAGCAGPAAAVVINEIHADPHPAEGDANGDGTVSTTQDEFVEIVNASGAAVDFSGWTLSDAVPLVRHVFPPGTVVADGCAVVVFAGGVPTGSFGGVVVQTASSGQLGLNNGGDTLTLNDGSSDVATAGYGSEGGNDQSLTLDPDVTGAGFVLHTTATGSGGARFSPGTRVDGTLFGGCDAPPAIAEIYEIQGAGLTSPFANQTVTTLGNTVTALASNGFFIQTPDDRADADPETSNGIFVFTGGAPGVAVGDQVDVSGQVVEFFDFTEFSNGPVVSFVSGGNPLPAAVSFDDMTPSPDQPQPATEFERYEGMRITVTGGSIASGNQRFGTDPIAEAFAVAGAGRPFREPGILFPGLPGIPVFDGNPEKFELDPDRLGLPNLVLTGGSTFDAEGVLGFEFGGYELWPTSLDVVFAAPLPVAVTARQPGEFTVGSLNLFRLFDDVDDPGINETVVSAAEYQRRLDKFSLYVRDVMGSPDVLAVEEAEKLGVLEDLADVIALDDPAVVYTAFLVEGNDVGGIDTGFLVRDTVGVLAVTQLAAGEILSVDGSLLHDRPPLLLEAEYTGGGGAFPIAVLALHQRSLSGIESPSDGPRVRQKRLEQAQSVATIVQDMQTADPDVHLMVIGDLNAFEFSDGYVDVVGQIAGDFVPAENLLSGPDLVDPDLAKLTLGVAPGQRYSFNFDGDAQALDHALTTVALTARVISVEYARGNSDAAEDLIFDDSTPLRSSDHDGLVVFVQTDLDGDGVSDEADVCPGTAIPEAVPTVRLLPLHYALVDGDGTFDTRWPPFGGIVPSNLTVEHTAGCSCDQIIDELGLGNGHRKFGCSLGVMAYWILTVNF